MEQVTGAALASVVALAYVLVVQAMTAAMLLLGQFIILQIRALRALSVVEPKAETIPAPVAEPLAREPDPQVVIGGGIRKWE